MLARWSLTIPGARANNPAALEGLGPDCGLGRIALHHVGAFFQVLGVFFSPLPNPRYKQTSSFLNFRLNFRLDRRREEPMIDAVGKGLVGFCACGSYIEGSGRPVSTRSRFRQLIHQTNR